MQISDQAPAGGYACDVTGVDPSLLKRLPASRFVSDQHEFSVQRSEEEWRRILSPQQYNIAREQGTEYPGTGEYDKLKADGIYYSVATGIPLFVSRAKYDSGTGWPSFFEPVDENAVLYRVDRDVYGIHVEVVEAVSGAHLGHVFPDGPPPNGLRYCINSAALAFVPTGGTPPPRLR